MRCCASHQSGNLTPYCYILIAGIMLLANVRTAGSFKGALTQFPHVHSGRGKSLPQFSRLFNAASGESFEKLGLHPSLISGLDKIGVSVPTVVQEKTLQHWPSSVEGASQEAPSTVTDLVIGSETGSGKTLAYLLPVFNELYAKGRSESKYKTSTFIVTPNKELSQQVLGVAATLAGTYSSVKWGGSETTEEAVDKLLSGEALSPEPPFTPTLAVLPGGLSSPTDFKPWRDGASTPPERFEDDPVHADIVICTPTTLAPIARDITNFDLFLGANNLIVDECDMVLDGGYFKALQDVLLGFRRKQKIDQDWDVKPTRHCFVGATIPDYGLRSVEAFITKKFPNATKISGSNVHSARHGGLTDVKWEEVDGDNDRFSQFLGLVEEGGLGRCMVFVNTVEAAENTVEALR